MKKKRVTRKDKLTALQKESDLALLDAPDVGLRVSVVKDGQRTLSDPQHRVIVVAHDQEAIRVAGALQYIAATSVAPDSVEGMHFGSGFPLCARLLDRIHPRRQNDAVLRLSADFKTCGNVRYD